MIKATTLKELIKLSEAHPYYCSESNYYSNKPNRSYETMDEFLEDFEDSDLDYNHVFRWDVSEDEDTGEVYAYVYLMLQRKGIFMPCHIENFEQESVERFVNYINRNEAVVRKLWNMEG